MYFLDTNTCIFYLNGTSEAVRDRILACPPDQIKIPSIVKAELVFGVYKNQNRGSNLKKLEAFLSSFEMVPFTDFMTYIYADIRQKTEQTGQIIGPTDLLIASITLYHTAVLVTNNTTEFRRVENLYLEDWTK